MEFFKSNTKIPFMQQRKIAYVFSAFIFIASLFALVTQHLNLGLDFTGGTQIEVSFPHAVDSGKVRLALAKVGFPEAVVQTYGTAKDLSIKVGQHSNMTQDQIRDSILKATPGGTVGQLQYIGPEVGKQLMTNGILAILVSLIATMIYIAIRFEVRFAVSAAVALIHDPMLILGIFALFHLEFNLIVLAAVLTVIGYSLNDTIVVYDRVRENFRKMRKVEPEEVMDVSINQTLSRTIMTSGLTLVVVVALFFFGGPVVHNFSLALIIGIVIGTYSSIYVAGALALLLGLNRSSLVRVVKPEDELP